jgi:hypothetical protein
MSDLIWGTNKDQEFPLFGLDISTALRETREHKSASIQEVSEMSSMKLVRGSSMLKCTCVVHRTWTYWEDRVQNCCQFQRDEKLCKIGSSDSGIQEKDFWNGEDSGLKQANFRNSATAWKLWWLPRFLHSHLQTPIICEIRETNENDSVDTPWCCPRVVPKDNPQPGPTSSSPQ